MKYHAGCIDYGREGMGAFYFGLDFANDAGFEEFVGWTGIVFLSWISFAREFVADFGERMAGDFDEDRAANSLCQFEEFGLQEQFV